jgi:hypothetical protein
LVGKYNRVYRRPDSVSTVAALNILFGGMTFLYGLLMLGNGVPDWMGEQRVEFLDLLKGIAVVDGSISVICGYNMFQGANWSRWVFTVDAVVSTTILAYIAGDHLNADVTTFVFRLICIVILFLPSANDFFGGMRRRR